MSNIPHNWREWLAKNYVNGTNTDILRQLMQENGFNNSDIEAELEELKAHPYIAAHIETMLNFRKRDWLLMLLNKYYLLSGKYSSKIERKNKFPSFATFLKNYYFENKPVIIRNAIDNWPAKNWTPELLRQKVGNPDVEVQHGREKDSNFEQNSHNLKTIMPFQKFMDEVTAGKKSNNIYLTANNASRNMEALSMLYDDIKQLGDNYMRMEQVKYSFIWIGPAGTFTPTHHDLTNNMFVQIYGRKKFWMTPAIQSPVVHYENYVFSKAELARPDYTKYPELRNATIMEFIVNPGDFLFIPLGWWHAVESLDASISVSSSQYNEANNEFLNFPNYEKRY